MTDYARILQVERDRFPSLDLVPSDPAVYDESVRRTKRIVNGRLRELEAEMRDIGAIGPAELLPEQLIPGSLHEGLDEYEKSARRHNLRPGSTELTPYGRLRLARVKRFRTAHSDIPLHALDYDTCTAMAAYWRYRPNGKRGTTSRDNARHHIGELMRFFKWLDSAESARSQWS